MESNTLKQLRVMEFLDSNWELHSIPARKERFNLLHFHRPGEEGLLKKHWSYKELFLKFIQSSGNIQDVIIALKGIPDVRDLAEKPVFELQDIYEIKQFIRHIRFLAEVWKDYSIKPFQFSSDYCEVWSVLNKGQEEQTFHIAESYSGHLKKTRYRIRDLRQKLRSEKHKFEEVLACELGIENDFPRQEFTVDNNNPILNQILGREQFTLIEKRPCQHVFRLTYPESIEKISAKLSELRKMEQGEEKKICIFLNECINRCRLALIADTKTLILWEKYFSMAMLAFKNSLKKPMLHKKNFNIRNGRYLPLKADLCRQELSYTPLSIKTTHSANVISGSNMGGKTQVLKTIGFLQGLFQLGFFLPAAKFTSCLFSGIYFSAAERFTEKAGLSSFGAEITYMAEALSINEDKSLFLVDEFSRTTNVKEGLALNYALIRYFSDSGSKLFLSTHFDILAKHVTAAHFQTGGMAKKSRLPDIYKLNGEEKIRLIHSIMDFHVYPRKKKVPEEALSIARLLGLPKDIVEKAGHFLDKLYV